MSKREETFAEWLLELAVRPRIEALEAFLRELEEARYGPKEEAPFVIHTKTHGDVPGGADR